MGKETRWKEEGIKTYKDRASDSDTGDGLLFASSQEPPLASTACSHASTTKIESY